MKNTEPQNTQSTQNPQSAQKPTRIQIKNRAKIVLFKTVLGLSLSAVFVAISILGKMYSVPPSGSYRVGFENTPLIMAGYFFGPIVGAIVAVTADLLGSLIRGNSINPIITIGAGLVGAVSGFIPMIWRKSGFLGRGRYRFDIRLVFTIFAAYLIGSVVVKSIGIVMWYGPRDPKGIAVVVGFRALTCLIGGTVEFFIINSLLNNSAIRKFVNEELPGTIAPRHDMNL